MDGRTNKFCGNNHNIYLRPSVGGGVFVGADNLTFIAEMVKRNKMDIDNLKTTPTSTPVNVEGRLRSLETTVTSLQGIPGQISTLTNSVNTVSNTVTNTNANARLLTLEGNMNNLQPTGQVATQLTTLGSRLTTLEARVSALASHLGSGESGLLNQIQTLEADVQNLKQLLTTNECQSNPCQNGGTCVDSYNGFICQCPPNWKGVTCSADVNECGEYAGTDRGSSQHGATCVNLPGSFRCDCAPNWYGILCSSSVDDCASASHQALCGHGTCINEANTHVGQPRYRCICDNGWTHNPNSSDPACNTDVNECLASQSPCSTDPQVQCINVPGTFYCGPCPAGFNGNGFTCQDINECEINNGGCSISPRVECINTRGSRACGPCPAGYQGNGVTCTWVGLCSNNNGGCHPSATCSENSATVSGVICTCPPGYSGNGVGSNGCVTDSSGTLCSNNPCQHGSCMVSGSTYVCSCNPGYTGRNCDSDFNECSSNPCLNGGTCINSIGSFRCQCSSNYNGNLCQSAQQSCGGYLNGFSGSFSYPPITGTNYSHSVSCAWQITTSANKILMITFRRFSLEFHPECNFDFLQIHDGPTASAHTIGTYCGNSLPNGGSINSTHNQLYFWFKSDASVASDGFDILWTSADPVCGGQLTDVSYGTINSPGYPGNYPINRDCIWTISASPGNVISITFAYMAIEVHANCSYDYLEIRSGLTASSPLVVRHCNTTSPPPVTTSGPFAYIHFHSDSSLSDRGFLLTYAATQAGAGCGGVLTGSRGVITSPNFPEPYNHNAMCVWTISVNSSDIIILHFAHFDLETSSSCQYDYLEVRDGINERSPVLGTYCSNSVPSDVRTTGNVMFVKFVTDSNLHGSGFSAWWTVGCGGVFTASQGTLRSPGYPNGYPPSKHCVYLISQPSSYRISLTFSAFDVENAAESCTDNYVEIRDGGSETSPLLGEQYCGSALPPVQTSTGNLMVVIFRTGNSVSGTGFLATYTAHTSDCGGILTGPRGEFTSPGHPNIYPHGVNCTWYIRPAEGLIVQLTFWTFMLEGGACTYDFVKVYDSFNADNGSLIGTYCGSSFPSLITSTNNALTVVFQSDSSVAMEGFSATYITQNATTACGRNMASSTGVITSPDFPNNYPHNRDCVWVITVGAGNQIQLNFTTFNLEQHARCQYDYLEISSRLWLRFHSDNSMSAPGFQIVYDGTASGCGGDLTTPTGSFVSPNYPNPYDHNAECYWTITVAQGSSILLTFEDFSMENHIQCMYDYVEVRENNAFGRQLGKFCGTTLPAPVNSTANKLWIKYRTDFSISGRGFRALYTSDCTNRLTAFSGAIESPNYPQPYPHNISCTWIIDTTEGNAVNISFATFDLESDSNCRYDYLEIRDGGSSSSNLLGKYCGSSIPSPLSSSGDQVWIRLVTDISVRGNGFHLEYITHGCGGLLTGPSGTFSSPNYPNSYDHARVCEWLITVETGKAISLTFTDFEMETSHNCQYDAVEVFAGSDDTGIMIAQLCQHYTNWTQSVMSTGNTMLVRMRTDNSLSGRGFSATFSAIGGGCGGNFTTMNGVIMSKNYPNNYPHSTECEWLIQLPDNHPVVINFTDFDVEGGYCSFDYVALYDGPNAGYPEMARVCGSSLPSPSLYRSSTNSMFVKMRTDSSVSGRGFKANFSAGCGVVKNASIDGVITSPNYPGNYPNNANCTWLITSSHNTDRITLTFTHMDIMSLNSCQYDYVRILNGGNINAPVIGTYCGDVVPSPITSDGSNLFVVFASSLFSQATGFRAVYTVSTSSCGGDFTAQSGAFNSPGYPNSYPPNTECVWTFQSSPGNRVALSFSLFNIEASDSCNNDYLEARQNDNNGLLLGRWCGTNIPTNVTAMNKVWVKFVSNDQITGVGFMGNWNGEYGGNLLGDSGQLSSPRYPQQYPNDVSVAWTITVSSGMQVLIAFLFMRIENSIQCTFDYVLIRDGGLSDSPEIGRYCGANLPGPIISTSNQVRIEFVTDASLTYQGFLLNWQATNEMPTAPPTGVTPPTVAGCGGSVVVGSETVTLTSPGYPYGYAANLNCIWSITTPVGQRIWLNISNIDLESHQSCFYDFVKIYNCKKFHNLHKFLLTCFSVELFYMQMCICVHGLSVDKFCGGSLVIPTGIISSPSYPSNYPSNSNCTWNVRVTVGRTVNVQFNGTFNIPSTVNCSSDYVQLLNGGHTNSPPLINANATSATATASGRYCGSGLPAVSSLETSSNLLTVNFVSDGSGSGTLMLTDSVRMGYFTSPNYPNPYPHNVECIWIISAPANKKIQVDFELPFRLEQHSRCRYDYIEFRDGGTQDSPVMNVGHNNNSRICGDQLPGSVLSTGNALYVRFFTDVSVTSVGFKAEYKIATCGGRIFSVNGSITSPNYPSNYESNSNCSWLVYGPVGHYLTFTFNAFNLESSTNCTNDFVEVREYNETGNLLLRACGSNLPASFDTSDSYSYVLFVSNQNVVSSGFSLSFQASVEECGGDLTTPSGVFTSPNFPGLYAHSRVCEWKIIVQQDRRVTLTFDVFTLEESSICAWDNIEVFNGIMPDSPRLGRFCGTNNPGVIESTGNTMRVRFRTDSSVSHGGFSARYTSVNEKVCGQLYTTPGNITSPGYYEHGNYTNNLECIWRVENPARTNSSILVIVDDLALEPHLTCVHDFLEVREGRDGDGSIIEKFCGNNTIPPPVLSPSQHIWLRFRTDGSIVDRGFAITVQFTTCGGELTAPQGQITSPNFPNNYEHNDGCAWLISAPEGERIRITFSDFNLEEHSSCVFDYLKILNGGLPDSPLIGKYCGTSNPGTILSQSNHLRLMFVTDINQSGRGFRATYTFDSEACGGLLQSSQGTVSSPNYPSSYPPNTECEWEIRVDSGYILILNVNSSFDLQPGDCSSDYLEITDILANGTQVLKGRYCSNAPPPVTSSFNRLLLKFHSDGNINGNGFSASWTSDCGGIFNSPTGVITSPGYPRNYRNNLRCNYTIYGDTDHYIILTFNPAFNLEGGTSCPYDYVQVFAGNSSSSPLQGRFCGNVAPQPVNALHSMHIRFWTDSSVVASGFQATYRVSACGGVYTEPTGLIQTPTYPSSYPHDSNCSWFITVDPEKIIALKFISFNVEPHSRCLYDYLDVFDGNNTSAPKIGRYCGTHAPDVIKSSGNAMYINFVTDSSESGEGFQGGYWSTYGPQHGCGGFLNQTSGQIRSVDINGDGNYEDNLDCRWTIMVEPNKLARLTFSSFHLEPGEECSYDSVAVYDGFSTTDSLLGQFCGSSIPSALRAFSNVMLVVFTTDGSIGFSGFVAQFGQEDALCGGILIATDMPQNISSPNYPSPSSQAVRCRWTIDSGAPNKQVSLTLLDIDLTPDAQCTQDYMEFRDSPMGELGQSVHYCGTTVPQTFYSAGQVVQVIYNTAGNSQNRGFILSYKQDDFNREFVSTNGRITSPGYPGVYPQNANCSISVRSPNGTTLALYFTQFHIEPHSQCLFDFLEIHNGSNASSPVLARLCGSTLPDPVFIPSNVAFLRFVTDASVQHVGYDITFTSTTQGLGCGGQLSGIKGSLTSPNFPGNFSDSTTCTWIITVPSRRVVQITFSYLAVPGQADCTNNYVEIFDGPSTFARTLGRFCNEQPSLLTASSNSATVQLVSTGSSPTPSFRIVYSS
ncbi:hypothetical protein C0Q70_02958 [Pomacea canaliculata]|uniref:Cubilin n=1 Tax=Pomacea canaliculata TaxID=400727 RepID=A0A2T7PRE4_POMCA|nr:hypothetical protein C0Q70_02958 [Pomacea canaliculata]